MCHLFEESAKADIFIYWSARKTRTWKRKLRSCFLSSFIQFRSAASEKKSKLSQPIRGQSGHLVFSDWPEKPKFGRGRWDLASYQASLNSVQLFQRRSRKCLSKWEARAAILFFRLARKNTNLVENVKILLPVKFRWIPFSGFRGEVVNVSANQRLGRPSCFSDRPEKHKLGRGHWDLASYQVSLNSVQWFQNRSQKCLSQSEARAAILFFRSVWKHKFGRGRWDLASCQVLLNSVQRFQRRSRKCLRKSEARSAILFFFIGPKNTNFVEDVEILLPTTCRWIWFSGFWGEVENVSANQRPGRPSCFSDRAKKHMLGRGLWDLASCQVSLNSVQWFQRRSRKCEKLTTDGWTDDGRTTHDHNSALEPLAQVN